MSLQYKIIISYILCIAIILVPMIYIMQTKIKTNSVSFFEKQTLQLIDSKANEIGAWINQRISQIEIMKSYPEIKFMNTKSIKNLVKELNFNISNNLNKYEEGFAIGNKDGIGWVSDDLYIDISDRSYFKKMMSKDYNKNYIISNPVNSKSDNIPIFLISSPIISKNNEKIGFINGSISLNKISNIAYNIDIYNGYSWIMNTNKDIYSIDKKILNKNFIDDQGLDFIIDSFNQKNLDSLAVLNSDGEDATVFYSSIPNADNWILCTIINDKDINAQINYIIDFIIKLGILFVLLGIIIAIRISGSIVKPIQVLKNNMTDVSNGNLNSYYKSKSNDEISILGKYFNQMLDDIKKLISKTQTIENQKRTAELKSLQAQINPHFLYNTLDTIQWKALEDSNFEIAQLVNSLSGLFRISLSSGKEFITIEDETKHAKYYLDIQKTRYKDKINYKFNIDKNLSHYLTPKLIIQPLIENSIYHGLKLKEGPGLILIKVYSKNDYIFIKIKDNGVGIKEEKLKKIKLNLENSIESKHYGLYNINERLKLAFSNKYNIKITSIYEEGTVVELRIPLISEGFECIE